MSRIVLERCPICSAAASAKYKPFCSARCADVDLGRWLTGAYVIPVPVDEKEEADDEGNSPGHDNAA